MQGPAVGAFVLTRGGRDHLLYGYIVGNNPKSDVKPGPFVLGKTYNDVSEGIALLRKYLNGKRLEDAQKEFRQAANSPGPRATGKS